MYELRQWLKESKHTHSPWGEKLDSNGYSKSLFPTKSGTCLLCRRECDTARHEVFFGTADRQTSKATGMWFDVCPACHDWQHRDPHDMHIIGQAVFERIYSHEEFIALFGENYI